ncbi:MAG: BolA family protein [Pseudomonadota bacterium]
MSQQSVRARLQDKLEAAFAPNELVITDESHLHEGHAGAREGGESHFRIRIVSDAFRGQNRVARQRTVYKALAEELAGPVHALALKTLTPEEAAGET